jgi:hypothetical protein
MVSELTKILTTVHPNDPKAHSIYGDFLVQDKKNAEAREEYLKVISTRQQQICGLGRGPAA